ncbi:MAG: ABC transporter ATP-binding protein [Bacteroidota bacterium]
MIRAENISISYGQKALLRSLDLTLEEGSMTALIGANGSGKSSLMRVLNGLQIPTNGTVFWGNRPLGNINRSEKVKIAGSIYSSFARVEGFKVYDLVALGRSAHTGFFGQLKVEDHEVIQNSLEKVGLAKHSEDQILTLSDGEFRKALLAKLLAQDTDILFLDEPTAHLDLPAALEFVEVLRDLANQGKTIVFSTHHLPLAFKMTDQIVLLDGKGEVAVGPPEDMTTHHMICDFLKTEKIRIVDGNLILDV